MKEIGIFSLANVSRSFATRAKGQEVIRCVCEVMAETNPNVMLVDWNGVSAASPSFIDEFINGIQEVVHTGEYRSQICFTGAGPAIATLLDVIAKRRAFCIGYTEAPDDFDGSQITMLGAPAKHA